MSREQLNKVMKPFGLVAVHTEETMRFGDLVFQPRNYVVFLDGRYKTDMPNGPAGRTILKAYPETVRYLKAEDVYKMYKKGSINV